MKRIKTNSIRFKVMLPMLIFFVLQTMLLIVIVFSSGLLLQFENNAFELLSERVSNRRNYLQEEMRERWGALDNSVRAFNEATETALNDLNSIDFALGQSEINKINFKKKINQEGETEKFVADLIFEQSYKIITDTIKSNGVTGAFVILKNEATLDWLPGLYIHCDTPTNALNDSMYLQVASAYMGDVLNKIYPYQNRELYFDMESGYNSKFFDEPYSRAVVNSDNKFNFKKYGYWASTHKIIQGGKDVISYSVPLAIDGKVYGVLGIELTHEYIIQNLPYTEINANSTSGSYVLAEQYKEEEYRTLVKTGNDYFHAFGDKELIKFEKHGEVFNKIYHSFDNDEVYAAIEPLQIYESNAVFSDRNWAIMGVIFQDDILGSSNRAKQIFLTAILSVFVVGLGMAVFSAYFISRPVTELGKRIRKMSQSDSVKIERTGIEEIDSLIRSFEKLGESVINNSTMLSKVIEISGLPIAAFEFNKLNNSIVYTNKFFDLAGGLGVKNYESGEEADLSEFMKSLDEHYEEMDATDGGRIYSYINDRGAQRWIKLKYVDSSDKLTGVVQDISDEKVAKNKIEFERDHDMMTNLLNRRAFLVQATKLFDTPYLLRNGALILIDLDNLKSVNDTYGHDIGDEYIKLMAKTLKAFLPENKVIVSRMSGDEFLVLLYGYDDKESVRRDVQNLEKEIAGEKLMLPNQKTYAMHCTAGVTYYPQDTNNLNAMINYSDFAMYEVKQKTKGKFNDFSAERFSKRTNVTENYEIFDKFVRERLVEFYYQPIVDIRTGKVMAYEALIRSKLPELPTAQSIINMARSQGKLYDVERLTWHYAMKNYVKQFEKGTKLFINSLPNQVLTGYDLEYVEDNYSKYLSQIVLEFTEEEKLNEETAEFKKNVIKKWGGQIALDDFGAGHNGDTVLLILNPNFIKIDMFIVRDIDKNSNKRKLIENLVAYASERKISVIAEGVETREELEALAQCNVDYIQGFYLGMPSSEPKDISRDSKKELVEIYKAYNSGGGSIGYTKGNKF